MCMIDDCEPTDFLLQRTPKARKPHKCSECKRTIGLGEIYLYSSFKADGQIFTHKSCEHCEVASSWLKTHCGGAVFFALEEDLREHYDSGYREGGVQRLLVGIRRGWKAFTHDGLLAKNRILR